MQPNPPPALDIVSVAVGLAAGVYSPQAAAIIGPYAVIILGSTLGASWSSSRIKTAGAFVVVRHIAGMVAVALLVTVPLAEIAAAQLGYPPNWVLGPLATGIGALGPDGLSWLIREGFAAAKGKVRRLLMQWATGGKEPPAPGGGT